jgi:hypothetical protein
MWPVGLTRRVCHQLDIPAFVFIIDMSFLGGLLAQVVEQLTLNQRAPGSSPGWPTILRQGFQWRAIENNALLDPREVFSHFHKSFQG